MAMDIITLKLLKFSNAEKVRRMRAKKMSFSEGIL